MSGKQRFRHRDVDSIACVLALLIGGGAFWWGVWPVLHAEDEALRLAKQMSSSQKQLEQAQADFRTMREQLSGTRQRLAEMAIVLDAPDQLAVRQAEMGRAFSELGITIDQLSIGTIEQGEILDLVPLQISGTGRFPDLVTTMHELRSEFPDMAVTSFQIAAGAGSAGAGNDDVTFSLGIAWYVARDETGRG